MQSELSNYAVINNKYVNTDSLDVYSYPIGEKEIIGQLKKGDLVHTRTRGRSEWSEIVLGTYDLNKLYHDYGYVRTQYLSDTKPSLPQSVITAQPSVPPPSTTTQPTTTAPTPPNTSAATPPSMATQPSATTATPPTTATQPSNTSSQPGSSTRSGSSSTESAGFLTWLFVILLFPFVIARTLLGFLGISGGWAVFFSIIFELVFLYFAIKLIIMGIQNLTTYRCPECRKIAALKYGGESEIVDRWQSTESKKETIHNSRGNIIGEKYVTVPVTKEKKRSLYVCKYCGKEIYLYDTYTI